MHRLIYQSCAAPNTTLDLVEDLARKSDEKNRRLGLTGILLCDGLAWCQVLEGPRADIHALWDEIKRDKRHTSALVVSDMPVAARMFPRWSMKLMDRIDLFDLLGLVQEMAPNTGFADVVRGMHGWKVSDEALSNWPSIYQEEARRAS